MFLFLWSFSPVVKDFIVFAWQEAAWIFRKEEIIGCGCGQSWQPTGQEGECSYRVGIVVPGLLTVSISSSTYEVKITIAAACLNHRVFLWVWGWDHGCASLVLLWRYKAKKKFRLLRKQKFILLLHCRRDSIHLTSQNLPSMLPSLWLNRTQTLQSHEFWGHPLTLETEEQHHVPKIRKPQPRLCFPDRGSRISTFWMHLDSNSSLCLTALHLTPGKRSGWEAEYCLPKRAVLRTNLNSLWS